MLPPTIMNAGKSRFQDSTPKNIFRKRQPAIWKFVIIFRYLSKYIIRQTSKRMNILFKALNDETRRKIVELLKSRDMTAGDIADRFSISKPSISHHLDLLRQADIVSSEKKGQFIYYSLNATVLDEMVSWFIGLKTRRKK